MSGSTEGYSLCFEFEPDDLIIKAIVIDVAQRRVMVIS